ncbi:MAG: cold shock domain-containing protein [Candidatus Thermoplasmatota archaeon]
MEGTIKKWTTSYGFIETDEVDKDVFVHESDVDSATTPAEGTKVKFDLREESRGPKAVNVEIIE